MSGNLFFIKDSRLHMLGFLSPGPWTPLEPFSKARFSRLSTLMLLASAVIIIFLTSSTTVTSVAAQTTSMTTAATTTTVTIPAGVSSANTVLANCINLRSIIGSKLEPVMQSSSASDLLSRLSSTSEKTTIFLPLKDVLDKIQMTGTQTEDIATTLRQHIISGLLDVSAEYPVFQRETNALNKPLYVSKSADTGKLKAILNENLDQLDILASVPCSNGHIFITNGLFLVQGTNPLGKGVLTRAAVYYGDQAAPVRTVSPIVPGVTNVATTATTTAAAVTVAPSTSGTNTAVTLPAPVSSTNTNAGAVPSSGSSSSSSTGASTPVPLGTPVNVNANTGIVPTSLATAVAAANTATDTGNVAVTGGPTSSFLPVGSLTTAAALTPTATEPAAAATTTTTTTTTTATPAATTATSVFPTLLTPPSLPTIAAPTFTPPSLPRPFLTASGFPLAEHTMATLQVAGAGGSVLLNNPGLFSSGLPAFVPTAPSLPQGFPGGVDPTAALGGAGGAGFPTLPQGFPGFPSQSTAAAAQPVAVDLAPLQNAAAVPVAEVATGPAPLSPMLAGTEFISHEVPAFPTSNSANVNANVPAVPTVPTTPETPVAPTAPATPATPTVPATPSTPTVPSTPSVPTTPSAPTAPTAPTVPATPTAPTAPTTPTAPTAPVTPEVPATPTAPAAPSAALVDPVPVNLPSANAAVPTVAIPDNNVVPITGVQEGPLNPVTMPTVNMPTVNTPAVPTVNDPAVAAVAGVNTVTAPTVAVPTVAAPTVTTPAVTAPTAVTTPAVPTATVPAATVPAGASTAFTTPGFTGSAPALPTIGGTTGPTVRFANAQTLGLNLGHTMHTSVVGATVAPGFDVAITAAPAITAATTTATTAASTATDPLAALASTAAATGAPTLPSLSALAPGTSNLPSLSAVAGSDPIGTLLTSASLPALPGATGSTIGPGSLSSVLPNIGSDPVLGALTSAVASGPISSANLPTPQPLPGMGNGVVTAASTTSSTGTSSGNGLLNIANSIPGAARAQSDLAAASVSASNVIATPPQPDSVGATHPLIGSSTVAAAAAASPGLIRPFAVPANGHHFGAQNAQGHTVETMSSMTSLLSGASSGLSALNGATAMPIGGEIVAATTGVPLALGSMTPSLVNGGNAGNAVSGTSSGTGLSSMLLGQQGASNGATAFAGILPSLSSITGATPSAAATAASTSSGTGTSTGSTSPSTGGVGTYSSGVLGNLGNSLNGGSYDVSGLFGSTTKDAYANSGTGTTNPLIPTTGSTSKPLFDATGQAFGFATQGPIAGVTNTAVSPIGFIADQASKMEIGIQVLKAAERAAAVLSAHSALEAATGRHTYATLGVNNDFFTENNVPVAALTGTATPATTTAAPFVTTAAPVTSTSTSSSSTPAIRVPTPASLLTAAVVAHTPPAPGTRVVVPTTGDPVIDRDIGLLNAFSGAHPTIADPLHGKAPEPGTDPLSTALNVAIALTPPSPPSTSTGTSSSSTLSMKDSLSRAATVMRTLATSVPGLAPTPVDALSTLVAVTGSASRAPTTSTATTVNAPVGAVPATSTIVSSSGAVSSPSQEPLFVTDTRNSGSSSSSSDSPPVLTAGAAPGRALLAAPNQPGSTELTNPLGGPSVWVICPPQTAACLTVFDGVKTLCYDVSAFVCTANTICPTKLPDVCGFACYDSRTFACVDNNIVSRD